MKKVEEVPGGKKQVIIVVGDGTGTSTYMKTDPITNVKGSNLSNESIPKFKTCSHPLRLSIVIVQTEDVYSVWDTTNKHILLYNCQMRINEDTFVQNLTGVNQLQFVSPPGISSVLPHFYPVDLLSQRSVTSLPPILMYVVLPSFVRHIFTPYIVINRSHNQ